MVSCRWAAQARFLRATTLVMPMPMTMNTRKMPVRVRL